MTFETFEFFGDAPLETGNIGLCLLCNSPQPFDFPGGKIFEFTLVRCETCKTTYDPNSIRWKFTYTDPPPSMMEHISKHALIPKLTRPS